MDGLKHIMDVVGTLIDAAGVLAVVTGVVIGTARFARASLVGGGAAHASAQTPYVRYRQDIGRAILLGLEFLVAGDIIRTVVVAPTLQNVLVLGLIVIIRTVLSMALQVELEGRWPWQRQAAERSERAGSSDG